MGDSNYKINNLSTGEITPRLIGATNSEYYYNACETLTNAVVLPHGGVMKRPGTIFIAEAHDSTQPVRLIKFEYNVEQTYAIELGNNYMRFYSDENGNPGIVVSGTGDSPYIISTSYSGVDLFDIDYGQKIDTMVMVHPDYEPVELQRYDHDDWRLSNIDFRPMPRQDWNSTTTTITASAVSGTVNITSSSAIFNTGHVGSQFFIQGDKSVTATISGANVWTTAIQMNAIDTIIARVNGTWVGKVMVQRSFDQGTNWVDYYSFTANGSLEMTEQEDDVYYRIGCKTGDYTSGTMELGLIIRNLVGYGEITSYTSSSGITINVLKELPSTAANKHWSIGAWSNYSGYPSSFTFSKQRSVYAGTYEEPQKFWVSQQEDYTNFDFGTSQETEAAGFTIDTNSVNVIHQLVDDVTLLACTSNGVWQLSEVGATITPTTPMVKRQITIGTENIKPIYPNGGLVFIQRGGHKLRAAYYSAERERYVTTEISVRAEHLLRLGKVVDMAYGEKPDSQVYMVLDSGDLVVATYDEPNNIIAFSKWSTTNGMFESVCTLPGEEYDYVYFVIKRTIGGVDKRYIEVLSSPFWNDMTDYIYVDSSISYDGVPKTTFSGADHLIGETVSIMLDGAAGNTDVVVDNNGLISISADEIDTEDTNLVLHAGLPYEFVAKTTRVHFQDQLGSSAGRLMDGMEVVADLYSTLTFNVGTDENNVVSIESLQDENYLSMAEEPYTGRWRKVFDFGWTDELRLCFTSDKPLPITILGLTLKNTLSER